MSEINLNWESAEVKGGELKVELDGDPSEDWSESFTNTLRLLDRGEWGKVALDGGTVSVSEVTEGREAKLHHFLEGVVEQANATQQAQEEQAHGERDTPRDEKEHEDQEPEGPDGAMTSRFRAFATGPEPSSEGAADEASDED